MCVHIIGMLPCECLHLKMKHKSGKQQQQPDLAKITVAYLCLLTDCVRNQPCKSHHHNLTKQVHAWLYYLPLTCADGKEPKAHIAHHKHQHGRHHHAEATSKATEPAVESLNMPSMASQDPHDAGSGPGSHTGTTIAPGQSPPPVTQQPSLPHAADKPQGALLEGPDRSSLPGALKGSVGQVHKPDHNQLQAVSPNGLPGPHKRPYGSTEEPGLHGLDPRQPWQQPYGVQGPHQHGLSQTKEPWRHVPGPKLQQPPPTHAKQNPYRPPQHFNYETVDEPGVRGIGQHSHGFLVNPVKSPNTGGGQQPPSTPNPNKLPGVSHSRLPVMPYAKVVRRCVFCNRLFWINAKCKPSLLNAPGPPCDVAKPN